MKYLIKLRYTKNKENAQTNTKTKTKIKDMTKTNTSIKKKANMNVKNKTKTKPKTQTKTSEKTSKSYAKQIYKKIYRSQINTSYYKISLRYPQVSKDTLITSVTNHSHNFLLMFIIQNKCLVQPILWCCKQFTYHYNRFQTTIILNIIHHTQFIINKYFCFNTNKSFIRIRE